MALSSFCRSTWWLSHLIAGDTCFLAGCGGSCGCGSAGTFPTNGGFAGRHPDPADMVNISSKHKAIRWILLEPGMITTYFRMRSRYPNPASFAAGRHRLMSILNPRLFHLGRERPLCDNELLNRPHVNRPVHSRQPRHPALAAGATWSVVP